MIDLRCSRQVTCSRRNRFLTAANIESLHENDQTQDIGPGPVVHLFNATSESDVNVTVEIKIMLTFSFILLFYDKIAIFPFKSKFVKVFSFVFF